jgi:ABC-2 type transport system permease protein
MALRGGVAACRAMVKERRGGTGLSGYLLFSVAQPVMALSITALVYAGGRRDLLGYAVVAAAANALVVTAVYYVGVLLDAERQRGTLVALFLTPCPRAGWLCGYALAGLYDAPLAAGATLLFGAWAFGVRYDPNVPAVLLSLTLLVLALGGLGFLFSTAGLLTRQSSNVTNLVWPFMLLLGGVNYPVALLPEWLRYPARLLPLGYGMQAVTRAALGHATISELAGELLPLAALALLLPVLGIAAFGHVERLVRRRGELDLY